MTASIPLPPAHAAALPCAPSSLPAGEPGFLAATRAAYDRVAASYAALLADALAANPHDRAVLALYAELVRAAVGRSSAAGASGAAARPQVAEVGCGPGRVTAHLAGLGLDARGIDLSPAMVAEARRRHPRLAFSVGSMTALDMPGASLDGLVAWYSVIHVPPSRHRGVYAGFHRVLRPDGLVLLAFQVGDERRRIENGYGHAGLGLDAYRLRPERVEQDLEACGFAVVTRVGREAVGDEKSPQAYVVARAVER